MLKSPKKTKYKAPHLHLGEKGLKGIKIQQKGIVIKSKQSYLLSPQQREVTRRVLARPIREKYGKLNIRFFPDHSMTKKPLQTRMG
jgi:large subunit ribosomal protein L16